MFGNLGNLGNLMKQFSEIKGNMQKMKQELADTLIVGKDPAEKVVIEMSGDLKVKAVHVDPSVMSSGNSAVAEACVAAALESALDQFRQISAQKLSQATGGLNIPGLM
ncbi:MAG: YbaB/EbfC family nucleoid-associated protein [Lentisphaeria bacterium]|nr:YbaB/EbfC family nucleoid-associated protein [Lentisphaeria bacterium]